jgi:hypothetical protein
MGLLVLLVHSEAGPIRGVSKRVVVDDAETAPTNVRCQAQRRENTKGQGGPVVETYCDDLSGREKGIYTALCEANDCIEDGFESCLPQLWQWYEATNADPPPCCGKGHRHLNERDDIHHRMMVEIEDNVTISIEANHPEEYGDWVVKDHMVGMQGRLAEGKITRAWDPLFQAYFKHADEVKTECIHSEDSFTCTIKSDTECGKDLIKALVNYHDAIIESIHENRTHAIITAHEIPESCKSSN